MLYIKKLKISGIIPGDYNGCLHNITIIIRVYYVYSSISKGYNISMYIVVLVRIVISYE